MIVLLIVADTTTSTTRLTIIMFSLYFVYNSRFAL